MPVHALSLVGFMEQAAATAYLQNTLLPDRSEQALVDQWSAARNRVQVAIERAGHPEMHDIPPEHNVYIDFFQDKPVMAAFAALNPRFQMVEIEPLLAYQFDILLPRSSMLTAGDVTPDMPELLTVCLPHEFEAIPFNWVPQDQGVLIHSRSLNLRLSGILEPANGMAGISFGAALPLVQVVRFADRCYLRNGFHRAYGLSRRGATHVPCLFLDATEWDQVGARGGRNTFDKDLLESELPPTLGHYTRGLAAELPMRSARRMIQVSWTEYVMADED